MTHSNQTQSNPSILLTNPLQFLFSSVFVHLPTLNPFNSSTNTTTTTPSTHNKPSSLDPDFHPPQDSQSPNLSTSSDHQVIPTPNSISPPVTLTTTFSSISSSSPSPLRLSSITSSELDHTTTPIKLFRRDPNRNSNYSQQHSSLASKTKAALARFRLRPLPPPFPSRSSHTSISSASICPSQTTTRSSIHSLSTSPTLLRVRRHRTADRNLPGLHLAHQLLVDPQPGRALYTLEYAPAPSRLLATAGESGTIYVFDLSQSAPRPRLSSTVSGSSCDHHHHPSLSQDDHHQSQNQLQLLGHADTVTCLAWLSSRILISGSMDKTVRMWDVELGVELARFLHADFVTAVAGHPTDDRYFLSGSLDRKLRLWDMIKGKVVAWTELSDCITSVAFSSPLQQPIIALAGLYSGAVSSFDARTLRLLKQIVSPPGRKVSSIIGLSNEAILVATNDSRLRLWSLIDPSNSPSRVMSGHKSQVGQLRASLGPRLGPAQQDLVVSGSEDGKVYVWGLGVDRRGYQESFKVNEGCVGLGSGDLVTTCAVFGKFDELESKTIEIAVTDDRSGLLRIFRTSPDL